MKQPYLPGQYTEYPAAVQGWAQQALPGGRNAADVIQLSKNSIQHIKKHTFEGMSEQAKYLTDEQLADKLANTPFFNKNWSQDEVVKYTQEAYNTLRSQRVFVKTSYGESSGNISELLENRPELTGTNREKLLSMVQDTKLAAYINEVYRPGG